MCARWGLGNRCQGPVGVNTRHATRGAQGGGRAFEGGTNGTDGRIVS